MKLSHASASRVRTAREELAYTWGERDHWRRLAAVVGEMIPGMSLGLLGWGGPSLRAPILLGGSDQVLSSGMKTPWASSGAILRHRTYDPSRLDPTANRVLTANDLAQRGGQAAKRRFVEEGLRPMGLGAYMRVTFYDGHRFLAMMGCARVRGDGQFNPEHAAMLQALIPLLVTGLGARQALEREHLAPGNVVDIANAIDGPAMIVAPGGHVVFANAMARAVYPKHPPWLEACASDEKGRARPPWVRRVPLVLGQKRLYLLMPEVLELDPELAPASAWAKKWKLAPREAKVAACIVQGLADKEIADRLGLTVSTARTYVKRLFSQAKVHSRTELMRAVLGVALSAR